MKVNIAGASDILAQELGDAAKFYGRILLHARTVQKIVLDIEVCDTLKDVGYCVNEDDCKNPRYFTIQIRNKPEDDDPVKTLAHEFVHLEQYATNRLRKVAQVSKGLSFSLKTEWEGKIWKPKKNQDPYFDSPWEIEAYGREVGLWDRWVRMYNLTYQVTDINQLL